mmetsp:Transcript_35888/g.46104  ORF Transcript_35888/g.46104 Transcript_35888/m.46104 type:complete len:98 (-) Transcript_35888:36-329(-)
MEICSLPFCSRCCTFFSFFAIILMVIFGALFDNQGYYVLGVNDSASEFSEHAQNCYHTAAIYAVFLVVSIFGWLYDNRQKARRESSLLDKDSEIENY